MKEAHVPSPADFRFTGNVTSIHQARFISALLLFIQMNALEKDWALVICMCEAPRDLHQPALEYCLACFNNHIQLYDLYRCSHRIDEVNNHEN